MRLVAQIRALLTLILLASYSPVGIAFPTEVERGDGVRSSEEFRIGHLAISAFTRRLTRVAAAEELDPTRSGVSRCPSRYVRRAPTERAERRASFYDRSSNEEGTRA